VTKLLDADPTKEVSVFGAVWIDSPAAGYVRLVKDIEQFERGGAFRVTKRIGDPPRLADFAALKLPEEDLAGLKTCKVGDSESKLSSMVAPAIRKKTGRPWASHHIKLEHDRRVPAGQSCIDCPYAVSAPIDRVDIETDGNARCHGYECGGCGLDQADCRRRAEAGHGACQRG
jgi:hypothetical protein